MFVQNATKHRGQMGSCKGISSSIARLHLRSCGGHAEQTGHRLSGTNSLSIALPSKSWRDGHSGLTNDLGQVAANNALVFRDVVAMHGCAPKEKMEGHSEHPSSQPLPEDSGSISTQQVATAQPKRNPRKKISPSG
jgi:hypothetical protein